MRMQRTWMGWMAGVAAVLALSTTVWAQSGGDTPAAAAEGLLSAWQAGNTERMKAFITESSHGSFDEGAAVFLQAIKIAGYKIGETTIDDDDPDTARVAFTWECTLDVDALVHGLIQATIDMLREAGLDDETLKEMIDEMQANMGAEASQFKAHIEQSNHVMTVVKIDGRWYVEQPMDDPDFVDGSEWGADSPEAAATGLLEAMRDGDKERAMNFASDQQLGFTDFEPLLLLGSGTAISEFSIGEIHVENNRAIVAFEWKLDVEDVKALIAGAIEALVAEMRQHGEDDESIAEIVAQYRDYLEANSQNISTHLKAPTVMRLREQHGRWFVVALTGGTQEYLQRGAATPQAAAQAVLAALQQRDFDEANWYGESELDANDIAILEMLWIAEYEVGEAKIEDNTATVRFTWSVSFDAETYVAIMLDQQRDALEAQGVGGDELEAALAELAESLAEIANELSRFIGGERHEMTLVKQNGRWLVLDLLNN